MADKKTGPTSAERGAAAAVERAERGELVNRAGRKMSAASLRNLKPVPSLSEMEPDRSRAVRQAGARAATEAVKRRRTIRDIYSKLLEQPDTLDGIEDAELAERAQQMAQQDGRTLTVYDAIAIAMAVKAKQGDVKAAAFVRDSAGDKPADAVEISADTMTEADRLLLQNIQARLQNNDTTAK